MLSFQKPKYDNLLSKRPKFRWIPTFSNSKFKGVRVVWGLYYLNSACKTPIRCLLSKKKINFRDPVLTVPFFRAWLPHTPKLNNILFPKPLVVSNLLILRGIWESCPEKEIENPINLWKIMKLANFHLKMSDHLQDAFFKIS